MPSGSLISIPSFPPAPASFEMVPSPEIAAAKLDRQQLFCAVAMAVTIGINAAAMWIVLYLAGVIR